MIVDLDLVTAITEKHNSSCCPYRTSNFLGICKHPGAVFIAFIIIKWDICNVTAAVIINISAVTD